MLTQNELREKITNQIVTALRAGNVPFWRQPWAQGKNAGYPANAVSGKTYRGINTLLTSLAALEKGYESKWWGTYPQWKSLGGQVRRGEKGTTIILFKPVRKVRTNDQGEEEVSSFPIMRSWHIWNVAQVDGDLDQFRASAPSSVEPRFVDYEPAEKVFAATGADIRFQGDRAFYSPEGDYIQLPRKEAFGDKAHEFYGVLAHETAHWTGHKSRLVFPRPTLHPSSKRPFYHREAVQICVEIRRTGIGLSGQIVLFNRKPKKNEQPKPLRKPVEEGQPAHDDLMDALKELGLTPTAQAVNEAVAAIYPNGLTGIEQGDVVRKVFLHLQGRRK